MRNPLLLIFSLFLLIIASSFIKQDVELFSFEDEVGKRYVLSSDVEGSYIYFSITGTDSMEMMYPSIEMMNYDSLNSWELFRYSYYFRGGGQENAGLDLNYVYFTYDSTKYVLYNNYSAEEDQETFGLKMIDLRNDSTSLIEGMEGTRKGALIQFRSHAKMKTGRETFD